MSFGSKIIKSVHQIYRLSLLGILTGGILFSFQAHAQDISLSGTSDGSLSMPRSKWGFSYFSFTTADQQDVQAGSPSVFIYNYISTNYKLSKDERINFRPVFNITTPGTDLKGKDIEGNIKLGDAYLNYANYKMALLPGDWELSGQFRIYFPTSESTQAKKTIAYLHSWMKSQKFLGGGWAVEYNFKPTLRLQSRPSVVVETETMKPNGFISRKREDRVNQMGDLEHYVSIGKFATSVFTPKLDVGFLHEWNYTSTENKFGYASRNQLKLAPNTEIHVNRSLWFILGIENTIDLNDTRVANGTWSDPKGQGIKFFQPEATGYYLLTFLTL
jgi:hypothetical protein